MKIARTLLAASLIACLSAPAFARDARETARIVKALAMQGGNERVLEAMRVLEQEGFLQQLGEALAEGGAASATAQPVTMEAGGEAPAAPGSSEEQIVQIAFAAAEPVMAKHYGTKNIKIGQKWVKDTTRGGRPIFEVKIMPEVLGIVSFFTTYTVDVDKESMKVTRVK